MIGRDPRNRLWPCCLAMSRAVIELHLSPRSTDYQDFEVSYRNGNTLKQSTFEAKVNEAETTNRIAAQRQETLKSESVLPQNLAESSSIQRRNQDTIPAVPRKPASDGSTLVADLVQADELFEQIRRRIVLAPSVPLNYQRLLCHETPRSKLTTRLHQIMEQT